MARRPRSRSNPQDPTVLLFSREAVRKLDSLAVSKCAMPSIVLMENASRHLAEIGYEIAGPGSRVLVVCGTGNNGGDGLAAARHLANAGLSVEIVRCGKPKMPDAITNDTITRKMKIPAISLAAALKSRAKYDLVIDAVLGTGLTTAPTGTAKVGIDLINRLADRGCKVLSADIPSGLDADTGTTPGACVKADVTVTFAGLKPGLIAGTRWAGTLWVAEIGVPRELAEALGEKVHW